MIAAIIGLPQSGKSTLYAAVTEQTVDPYAPPEPRRAVAQVPDPRLLELAKLCNPKKIVRESIEICDIPGCSLDAPKGQDDWRRMLPTVRMADVLVVVVRAFENAAVPPYRNRIDPAADFAEVWDELIFADLESVTKRTEKLEAALKKPSKTHEAEKHELALLSRCREALEGGEPLSTVLTRPEDRKLVSSFGFLTELPIVCVLNVADDAVGSTEPVAPAHVAASVVLSAGIEAEIAALEPDERGVFLEDLGLAEPARDRLIRACYDAGGLISFLTMGPDEVRAWSVRRGATAVDAAGRIHTDLARAFIRAETVAYADLMACGDMKGAKAAGKVRKEGKTYIVEDGDVMLILANA